MQRPHVYTLSALVITLVIGGIVLAFKNPSPLHLPSSTTSKNQTSSSQKNNVPPTGFNKQLYSISDPASIWVVVNKTRPLNPNTYAPSALTPIGNGQLMRLQSAQALATLFAAAKTAGFSLYAESGYRSYGTQAGVYASEVKNFGQATADSESARPGYSEHQTGWAVDIASPGCVEDCFGKTTAAAWVNSNAYTYGFIQRYPTDKTAITGYRNEPWHYRYIGVLLATEMRNKSIKTLEEFFGLPPAPDYK
ncbi:MAG TPA: M15 family metallopeptidase [Patescibacteria group bacterium]|nr:M15 family metallopeptidase [Patescibacteria group bacterium]